jgi:UDP-N-acetylmuramoyl-L-alanyl-D-glutamate--2,6-diaminopimelate ligase
MGPGKGMRMRLKELIGALGCAVEGPVDVEVTGISADSREIRDGYMFVALPGGHVDGIDYAEEAVKRGAKSLLTRRRVEGVGVAQLITGDVRAALSRASDAFYGAPSGRVALVGVTGTNGKTTTTYLLESVFREAGFNPGVIGTVNYRYGGLTAAAPHTTPQAHDLQRMLKEMADAGVTHCALEVSSHALAQKRVADCRFRAGVFTNLTHEHLDYHGTMEAYYGAKALLFAMVERSGGAAVTNVDDPWGARLKRDYPFSRTYGLGPGADYRPIESSLLNERTEAVVSTPSGPVEVSSPLVGEYNLQNILAAVAVADAIGIGAAAIGRGIASLARVPGRLEKVEAGVLEGVAAYVDYAHTGDALDRALKALRRISGGRMITVFGCGGDRDRKKRPEMGSIAVSLSDLSILTSDNPRDEDPLDIIREIESGIAGVKRFSSGEDAVGRGYLVMPDRGEAIREAVRMARPGDTILVAGKGHEDYQIVKAGRFHFNDMEEISAAMAARRPAEIKR